MVSPRSVVLVDGAGEWRRFPLSEDSVLRRAGGERGIPISDASRTGYPSRMRRGPGSGDLATQLEPGDPVEPSADPEERLTEAELVVDPDELVEDVAHDPRA